jgi:hypothetical protein
MGYGVGAGSGAGGNGSCRARGGKAARREPDAVARAGRRGGGTPAGNYTLVVTGSQQGGTVTMKLTLTVK